MTYGSNIVANAASRTPGLAQAIHRLSDGTCALGHTLLTNDGALTWLAVVIRVSDEARVEIPINPRLPYEEQLREKLLLFA